MNLMQSQQQRLNYETLELISSTSSASQSQRSHLARALQNWFSQVGRFLQTLVILDANPRIWQRCDRAGNTWWTLYDPVTQRFYQFSSESEVRMWLDEQFIQRSGW